MQRFSYHHCKKLCCLYQPLKRGGSRNPKEVTVNCGKRTLTSLHRRINRTQWLKNKNKNKEKSQSLYDNNTKIVIFPRLPTFLVHSWEIVLNQSNNQKEPKARLGNSNALLTLVSMGSNWMNCELFHPYNAALYPHSKHFN